MSPDLQWYPSNFNLIKSVEKNRRFSDLRSVNFCVFHRCFL